jgi:hypothetical protein
MAPRFWLVNLIPLKKIVSIKFVFLFKRKLFYYDVSMFPSMSTEQNKSAEKSQKTGSRRVTAKDEICQLDIGLALIIERSAEVFRKICPSPIL